MVMPGNQYPSAVSRLIKGEDSRESQIARAIQWLLTQGDAPIVVVTPRKSVESSILKRVLAQPGVLHKTWKDLSKHSLERKRVLHMWPDEEDLEQLWDIDLVALAVVEWTDLTKWAKYVGAEVLPHERTTKTTKDTTEPSKSDKLPERAQRILEHLASAAAAYSGGLKWDEEEKLKSDLMLRRDAWQDIPIENIEEKCRELRMRPGDTRLIVDLISRRQRGCWFNLNKSRYKGYEFKD